MERSIAGSLILTLALLTACSGSNAGGAIPQSGAASGAGAATKTAILIRVPKRPKRRAHYIGLTTQSVSVTVTPASGCAGCSPAVGIEAGLGATSPNCVDGAAATTCSLALVLKPGTYTGSIVTYNGPLNGSHIPTGTILSKNQSFPMTIVSGKVNDPVISLYGVPSGIQFSALTNNLAVLVNNPVFQPNTAFLIAGPGARARFAIYATDPDGNVILGPGAPTFSVATSGSFSASVSGSTGQLSAPPVMSAALTTMTFTASSPACVSAASCTWKTSAGFDSLLAIGDHANDDVVVQTSGINAGSPLFATVRNGISDPIDVKFDATGDLFVANYTGNTVTEYAPPYTGAPIATISNGVNGPNQLAFAPNGTLAVVNAGGGNVTVYSPPFASASPIVISAVSLSATFDSNGALWLGEPSSIRRYAPPFTTPSTTTSSGVASPSSIAFDGGGDLYVANIGNPTIEAFASNGLAAPPFATASMPGVSFLTIFNAFIVACGTGGANLYGATLTTPLSDPSGSTPCHAAFDRMYGLWLTDPDSGLIVDYLYPPGIEGQAYQTAGLSQPQAIAAFP